MDIELLVNIWSSLFDVLALTFYFKTVLWYKGKWFNIERSFSLELRVYEHIC